MPTEHIAILRLSCGPAAVEWHLGEIVDPSCLAEIISHRVSMKLGEDGIPILSIGGGFVRGFSDDVDSGGHDRFLFPYDDDIYDFYVSSEERHQDFRDHVKQFGTDGFKLSGCTVETDGMTFMQWPAETGGLLRGYTMNVFDPAKVTNIEMAALRGLVQRATTPPTKCTLTLEHGPATVEWHLRDMTDPNDIEKIVSHEVSMRLTARKELELLLGDKGVKIYENRIFNEKNDQIAFWLGREDKSEFEDYVFASSPYRYSLFRDHVTQFGTDGFKLAAYEIISNSKTLDQFLSD